MNERIKKHSTLSNMGFWIGYYWKYRPIAIWSSIAIVALSPLFRMLSLYFPKVVLSMVEQSVPLARLLVVLGGYTLVYLAVSALNNGLINYSFVEINDERTTAAGRLFLKSLRIPYSMMESEEGKNSYRKAIELFRRGGDSVNVRLIAAIRDFCTTVLLFVLYSTVLGQLSIWMVFFSLALAGLSYLVQLRDNRFRNEIRGESAVNDKRYYYVKAAMGNPDASKDVRIFNMGGWLKSRLEEVLAAREGLGRRQGVWIWKIKCLSGAISLMRDLVSYAYLIYMAAAGKMTASDFVLYFSAITGFSGFVSSLAGYISVLRRLSDDTDWMRYYLEMPDEDNSLGSRHITDLAQPISIEFRDVSFSYRLERETKQIFSHLNLKIEAGEKLALVGVNGAGKTSLVKLLCGLYEPDEGQILFNGIDAREFSKTENYELFSVVFQDMYLPSVRVDESIVLKEAEDVDQNRLKGALEKAGLWEVFSRKKIAMDRYMGTDMRKNGVEMSGGQRQRLLMARALYKNGAVMVLDEPTAALDPIAESEVYQAYQEYSHGRTSIFISHRLASTSFSDRIVLLDKGRIVEMGSHEELMAANGAYAEMFRIQSSYYREENE